MYFFFRKFLKDLVPMDLLKQLTPDEWKKVRYRIKQICLDQIFLICSHLKKYICASFVKNGTLNRDDAKVRFLEVIYKWPTFGSAFFEVKVKEIYHFFVEEKQM